MRYPSKTHRIPGSRGGGDPWGYCGSENKDSRNEMRTTANQSYAAGSYLKAARAPRGSYSQLLLQYHNEDPCRAQPETEHINRSTSSTFPQPPSRVLIDGRATET